MDLILWLVEESQIHEIQLTVGKPHNERAIHWVRGGEVRFRGVDDGSRPGKHPGSPVFTEPAVIKKEEVLTKFRHEAEDLDKELVASIISIMGESWSKMQDLESETPDKGLNISDVEGSD